MKDFYEVGRIYIWQNAVGIWEHLNGKETTVTGHLEMHDNCFNRQGKYMGQRTDTPSFQVAGNFIIAEPGDLRPKDLPPGEKSITDLFKLPQDELTCV